jgi:AraC family transcriptional regulator, exoenzyme S synthesis regulatory protein ExsA
MKQQVARSLVIGPVVPPEQFLAVHRFCYILKGKMEGHFGNKYYSVQAGQCGIMRKNYLGRHSDQKEASKVDKVVFIFDDAFLQMFQEKHHIVAAKFKSAEPIIPISVNKVLANFIASLSPYYNHEGVIDKAIFDLKREELLIILLQAQPEISGLLFDPAPPEKIDLEEFMNQHYIFNVKLERFAYLTGRSLSAFKRDFKQIFNDTPNRWLVQKRLTTAYKLIKEGKKPAQIFLDLGFEDLSHFCYAFKKRFGVTPTALATSR